MWIDIVLGVLPLIMPYTILGENLSSIILSIVGLVYLILSSRKGKVDKKFFIIISLLNLIAIVSTIFISPCLESISGLSIYLNIVVYYIIYSKSISDNKDAILKYMVFAIVILDIYYVIVQGMYYNIRIYGNIGYANSYALLLLIGIYLNRIRQEDKYTDYIELIIVLGILYTGSRTTILLIVVYLIARIVSVNKKNVQNITNIFESSLWALLQYIVYSTIGLKSLIVMPVIIYIYIIIKKSRIKRYIYGILVVLSIILMIVGTSNTLERIRNISTTNGTLQERLVYYEDTINSIIKQPLGNGINTFQYKSYHNASAFYDVKYVHNSILQVAFDLGIPGVVVFLVYIIMGFMIVLRSKNILFIGLYASIIIHSLLDFDMSYTTFGIVLVMIVVLTIKSESATIELRNTKLTKVITISLVIILIYLGIFEGSISLGKTLQIDNKILESNRVFNVANNISFGLDYRGYFNEAQGYKSLYDDNSNKEYLNKALTLLIKTKQINKDDPRILWNMTYIYMKLDNDDKALEFMDKLLTTEKFNNQVYKLYCDYFSHKKDGDYSQIVSKIQIKYDEAKKSLNPRAIYMKNQLK